jgi:hypothetical protein
MESIANMNSASDLKPLLKAGEAGLGFYLL